ncbi:TraB/GumN family protein [Vibrio kagoshimensis]|uniref:TraB/GumN family protein n=1 Tax=Vibrio gallaecicus TaxID=552386 RepID=A0ABV4N8P9_9VIBR
MRLLALFSNLLCVIAYLSATVSAEPLYWSAKKDNKEFLIFGSVHVGSSEMYPLPKAVTEYLSSSDGLILETDVRKESEIRYPKNQITTKSILTAEQKRQLTHISQSLNLNSQQMLNAAPWITALTVQIKRFQQLGYENQYGIDNYLGIQATLNNKPVLSLEPMQFQIDLISGLKNDGQELLVSGLNEWEHSESNTHCLFESWESGDKQNLQEMGGSSDMSDEMIERFVFKRNHDWAKQLDGNDLVGSNSRHLIVVGTLHLVGEQNLILLLKDKGFTVRQLSTSKKAPCAFVH